MEPASFHKLVLTEVDSVYRLAHYLCHDPHEVDDLVQETYLRALRSAESFSPGDGGVRPWLFKILHNVQNTRRSRDRRARESLKRLREKTPMEASGEQMSYPSSDGNGMREAGDVAVNWENLDERLCQSIRLLPVTHRSVFLLSAVEGLKYHEIADVMGVPIGTVMSRLSRARSALAVQLVELANERNMRPKRSVGDATGIESRTDS